MKIYRRAPVALLMLAASALAQSPVENINQVPSGPASSSPRELAVAGDRLWFIADVAGHGSCLCRTDVAGGTVEFLHELEPGDGELADSFERIRGLSDGRVLLMVDGDDSSEQVWISDGATSGTVPLLVPGPSGSQEVLDYQTTNVTVAEHAGQAYFFASPGYPTRSVYRTTGTPGVAELVWDFGGASDFELDGEELVSCGGELWCTVQLGGQLHLLRSADPMAGYTTVAILPVDATQWVGLYAASAGVAITAVVPGEGRELWVSDGTPAGTAMVDLLPGAAASDPRSFAEFGGELYFSAITPTSQGELFRTDGTVAGTVQVSALPDHSSAAVRPFFLAAAGDQLWFQYSTDGEGVEPWRTDGTFGGAVPVADLAPGSASSLPRGFVEVGGAVYFRAETPATGAELYVSDGTPSGTVLVAELEPGPTDSIPANAPFAAFGGRVFFAASSPTTSEELFASDGTPAGTQLVVDLTPDDADGDSAPWEFTSLGDRLVFTANDGVTGRELWAMEDPTLGAELVVDLDPTGLPWNEPGGLTRFGQHVYFSANDGTSGIELFRTDGTAAGTTLVHSFIAGPGGGAPDFRGVWRGHLYFTAGQGPTGTELWRTDGTSAGTQLVHDIAPGPASSLPSALVEGGDWLWFSADDGEVGRELWRTDGTAAGTERVTDLAPGVADGLGDQFEAGWLAGKLYFRGALAPFGSELIVTDGTPAGTALFADLASGDSDPAAFHRVGARLVFRTQALGGGRLYATDGASVVDLLPGTIGFLFDTDPVFASSTHAFAFMVEGSSSRFLVATDGTIAGSGVIGAVGLPAKLAAASLPTNPFNGGFEALQVSLGSQVVFTGFTPVHGNELWITDGTPGGTTRLTDVAPGPLHSGVNAIGRLGAELVFPAWSADAGLEPYSLPIAAFGGWVAEAFGQGCPGSSGLAPTMQASGAALLGNVLNVEVGEAAPASVVGHYYSLGYALGSLGTCELYLAAPVPLAVGATDGSGSSSLPIAIPNVPALVGQGLWIQSVVVDPGGALLGVAGVTPALEVIVGG
ncbi:ELWxxDGT repeat protein [Engelhardtia mirabilis]|uniref:Translocation protein TolB n=1 Tax=Engelhardtia mirabilis TaxID=2528011 RepID=A0A518BG01_9BACT|nr:hypothetical protein Pla133_09740 [Planctomycetes bacterium Pla133]QDV00234.1 hypothetical protein Pla86_09730 [Planctomycetes bacterium Pla86]